MERGKRGDMEGEEREVKRGKREGEGEEENRNRSLN